MPIKFRCNYCHQFLGISRNRAGGVVDCPTCGRTIRVPELDGSVAPLPPPEIDSDDSHLARALDELAALAQIEHLTPVAVQDEAEPDDESPQPLPEPVPVEIPVPVTVPSVVLPAVASVEAQSVADVAKVLEELNQTPDPEPAAVPPPTYATTSAPAAQWPLVWLAVGPVLCLLIGLCAGWMIGSSRGPRAPSVPAPAVAAKAAEGGGIQARGRISYQAEDGQTHPDVGAGVLLLPAVWDAANRLYPAGLRPADSPADQRVAAAVAEAMQGGLTWTNAAGEFELSVPAPGTYRLVVLSRLAARPDDKPIESQDLEKLRSCLHDPDAALGRRAYVIRDVEVSGMTSPVWDHQFPR